jgi:translation initiation factor 1
MPKKKLYSPDGFIYSTDPDFSIKKKEDNISSLPVQDQLLRIKLDNRHRGGKVVTLIEGFMGPGKDIDKLGKELKSFCATGGSVKDDIIMVQGDNREKILQWLKKNGYLKAKLS